MTETENKDLPMQKQEREEIKLHGENQRASHHLQGYDKNETKNQYVGNVSAICWSEGLMNGTVYDGKTRVQSLITSGNKNQT